MSASIFKKVCQISLGTTLSILGITTGNSAFAATIFDNGTPDLETAWLSDFAQVEQKADDFTLSVGNNTISNIQWWGVYVGMEGFDNTPTEPDDFTVRIFEDAEGSPSVNPLMEMNLGDVGRVATGDKLYEFFDIFEYQVNIPQLTLTPNTTYWLSIVNNTIADPDDDWYWLTSAAAQGNSYYRFDDSESWSELNQFDSELGGDLAFQLSNDSAQVPEPASVLGLLALGTLGAGSVLKRNCKRKS